MKMMMIIIRKEPKPREENEYDDKVIKDISVVVFSCEEDREMLKNKSRTSQSTTPHRRAELRDERRIKKFSTMNFSSLFHF